MVERYPKWKLIFAGCSRDEERIVKNISRTFSIESLGSINVKGILGFNANTDLISATYGVLIFNDRYSNDNKLCELLLFDLAAIVVKVPALIEVKWFALHKFCHSL